MGASPGSFQDFTDLLAAQLPVELDAGLLWLAFPFAVQLAFLAYLDTMLTSLVVHKLTAEETRASKEPPWLRALPPAP